MRRVAGPTSSLKDREVQRHVLIAAGIYAVVPAAIIAGLLFIRLLASGGILPEAAPPLALLMVFLAAIVWLLIPFRKTRLVPDRYFERYQVSDAEKKVGLGVLISAVFAIGLLWRTGLFGLLGLFGING